MKGVEGVPASEVWASDMHVFFAPAPGKRNGRWLTIQEIAAIIDRFGPSYVEHFNPEWAPGGER